MQLVESIQRENVSALKAERHSHLQGILAARERLQNGTSRYRSCDPPRRTWEFGYETGIVMK